MKKRLAIISAFVIFIVSSRVRAGQVAPSGAPAADAPESGEAAPTLKVVIVPADPKTLKKSATVKVEVQGLKLVDPGSVRGESVVGEGHLHYQLDLGPVIATTATTLCFQNLKSGPHTITVALASDDRKPIGPATTLSILVP
jgi:hypothetical protein